MIYEMTKALSAVIDIACIIYFLFNLCTPLRAEGRKQYHDMLRNTVDAFSAKSTNKASYSKTFTIHPAPVDNIANDTENSGSPPKRLLEDQRFESHNSDLERRDNRSGTEPITSINLFKHALVLYKRHSQ